MRTAVPVLMLHPRPLCQSPRLTHAISDDQKLLAGRRRCGRVCTLDSHLSRLVLVPVLVPVPVPVLVPVLVLRPREPLHHQAVAGGVARATLL